jgi:hypothetical protein
MLTSPDRAAQLRADRLERCQAFLEDAIRHLETAAVDPSIVNEALARLLMEREGRGRHRYNIESTV